METASESQHNFSQTLKEQYSTSHGKTNKQTKTRRAKTILYNKGTSEGITNPDFKLYYRATIMKIAWYWHKNREFDQCDLIEELDINSHTYDHLIFDKEAKITQWKKENTFNK